MIQDMPTDMLKDLPERGTDLLLYVGGAFFTLKMALNGMRADVRTIKERQEKDGQVLTRLDARFESVERRVERLEDK